MPCDPLENIQWHYADGEYILQLTSGKAVIKEDRSDGNLEYKPQIITLDDEVISSFPHGLDFDSAQAFIRANLIELDKHNINDADFTGNLITTLDMCIELLRGDDRKYHRMRLENIKRWLRDNYRAKMLEPDVTNDWKNYAFDWEQTGNLYEADTVHGKATIQEVPDIKSTINIRSATRYKLQIIDTTGVVYDDYFPPPLDFLEAERNMRNMLTYLEHTYVDEDDVISITFTIEICQCLLPEDTDLMHFVRLSYIDYYLGEVLP